MGYKLLGFAVWQGGKWYARRRLRAARGKLAVAVVSAVAVAGLVAAGRAASSD